MEEVRSDPSASGDITNRLVDLEEKNRLIRDRVLLLGQTVIEGRDKNFKEIQEIKGAVIKLREEVDRIKELLQRMAEQVTAMARKEELMIIQRQLDLLRK